jgi:hypothetical protein
LITPKVIAKLELLIIIVRLKRRVYQTSKMDLSSTKVLPN